MRRNATCVVADVAAHGLAVGQVLRRNLSAQQRFRDVAAPNAVRHGNHHIGGANAFGNSAGHIFGNVHKLVLGQFAFKHYGFACGNVVCGMERYGLNGGVGQQLCGSCGTSCARVARGKLFVGGTRMRVHELVKAGGIGVAIVHLHARGAVAGNGKAFAGHQAAQQLRGLAQALVVVNKHVRKRVGSARAVVATQVIHGQVARFGLHDAARERKVCLQQVVHVGFLAGQKPLGVVVGQLGPAAVEELQHFAQTLRAQAADLHILKQEQLLVRGKQARFAARPADGFRIAQHVKRQSTRSGYGNVCGIHTGSACGCGKAGFERSGCLRRRAHHQHVGAFCTLRQQFARAVDKRLRFAGSHAAHNARGGNLRSFLSHFRPPS